MAAQPMMSLFLSGKEDVNRRAVGKFYSGNSMVRNLNSPDVTVENGEQRRKCALQP